MKGICPVCDTPGMTWWVCSFGILQEVVCVTCGLWATHLINQLSKRKERAKCAES